MKQSDAKLWMKAHKQLTKRLGKDPMARDFVAFAQSKAGKYIRHLFPFNDVQHSAERYWLHLAQMYMCRVKVLFASDPNTKPLEVRAQVSRVATVSEIRRIILLPQVPDAGFVARESALTLFAEEVMARLC